MVDDLEKKILSLLNERPFTNQNEIATELKITRPTVYSRLQKLREEKIFHGYAPIINLEKIGFTLTVLVNTKIKNGKLVEAAQKYAQDPNVCSTYTITGEYDMLVIAKFHDTKELEQWNQKMTQDTEYIERVNTSLVFTTQKERTNPNKIE